MDVSHLQSSTTTPPAVPATEKRPNFIVRSFRFITGGGWLLLFFITGLPLITLLVELWTGMCANAFFNPMPNGWYVASVALVPAAYLIGWLVARYAPLRLSWTGAFMTSLAQGVSIFFALLMLPLVLLGILILFLAWWYLGFGLVGFLPMSPLLAFIGGFFLRRRLKRAYAGRGVIRLRGSGYGWLAALLVIVVLVVPEILTLTAIGLSISENDMTRAKGIALLRRAERRDMLLQLCNDNRDFFQVAPYLLLPTRERISQEQAYMLYYRVTGEDPILALQKSVTAPFSNRRYGNIASEIEWDRDTGGNRVGGTLSGLSLFGSRYEARADAASGLAYAEWTMVFRNTNRWQQREARARIALPPGAVVSRLTLWIDGEEREAAFGGRSKVRQAYERIVSRRRDPVLVSTCGPDRIQVQCFPVPPEGGEMKFRIGFTAPLNVARDGASGTLDAPAIVERNFKLTGVEPDLPQTLTLSLDPPLAAVCQAQDTRTEPAMIVRQTAEWGPSWRPEEVALVVDDSITMRPAADAIMSAIDHLPPGLNVTIWKSGDGVPEKVTSYKTPADKNTGSILKRELGSAAYTGGRCSLATLIQAWDGLSTTAPAVLIWLHGPQPYLTRSGDSLIQRLERAPKTKRFYTAQVVAGNCKISEALDGVGNIQTLAPAEIIKDPAAPLHRLFATWAEGAQEWHFKREVVAQAEAGDVREASDMLVRQWTADKVRSMLVSGAAVSREKASELALRWDLVTPVSSAMVLETAQQYKDAGLEPVSAASVPTVPEPGFWAILIAAVLMLFVLAIWRYRHAIRRKICVEI